MKLPSNERRMKEQKTFKKIWFYGLPYSGKTYLANKFPNVLMLNTDGNVKFVDAPFIPIKDEVTMEGRITKRVLAWQIFKDAILELEKQNNDFETIVVDLLEDTYEYCRLYMYDKLGIEHESDDSFKAWDKVRIEFLSTIKRLLNLNYNIILLSHEDGSRDITKKGGDKITSVKPNIQDKLALKVAGMVDFTARIVNEDGKRSIHFKTNEYTFGGGRLEIKALEVPCTYEGVAGLYGEEGWRMAEKPRLIENKPVDSTAEAKVVRSTGNAQERASVPILKPTEEIAPLTLEEELRQVSIQEELEEEALDISDNTEEKAVATDSRQVAEESRRTTRTRRVRR